MKIIPINFSDFNKVCIKNKTPHCLQHGAMNKITVNEDGGGYWRCISVVSKTVDTVCRAGCCEVRKENILSSIINWICKRKK